MPHSRLFSHSILTARGSISGPKLRQRAQKLKRMCLILIVVQVYLILIKGNSNPPQVPTNKCNFRLKLKLRHVNPLNTFKSINASFKSTVQESLRSLQTLKRRYCQTKQDSPCTAFKDFIFNSTNIQYRSVLIKLIKIAHERYYEEYPNLFVIPVCMNFNAYSR